MSEGDTGSGSRTRKERVLHTRVSERLAEDIRRVADDLRVPVSNLVRNVLEDAFDVVETVTGDVGSLLEDVLDEAEGASRRLQHARARRRQRSRRGNARRGRRAPESRSDPEPGQSPPPPPVQVDWHYVREGERAGPVDRDTLADLLRRGSLGRDTLVWCAGMPDWRPASRVDGLADLFEPPPVPDGAP